MKFRIIASVMIVVAIGAAVLFFGDNGIRMPTSNSDSNSNQGIKF